MNNEKPNIVMIIVDQWRGDCLGHMGHPFVQTPHLDRLAMSGVSFCNGYSATPSCIAARAGLLTGLNQAHHGRVGYQDGVAWNYKTTIASVLADAGYHTQCIGKQHVHPSRNLMGFHNVVLHDGYMHFNRRQKKNYSTVDDYLIWLQNELGTKSDYIDGGIGCNGMAARPWPHPEYTHPTNWVTTEAIDFLRRRDPGKPFFLNVSYHRPHPPFDPPRDYWDLYQNVEIPDPLVGDWARPLVQDDRHLDSPIPSSSQEMKQAWRAYLGLMTHIDHQINRLNHALIEAEVMDETAIVFVSDHGELLYEHNLTAKGCAYEGASRIPFIIKLPKSMESKRGAQSEAVVELRDIFPTFCDIAGIDTPEHIDGKSIVPLCEKTELRSREFLHGEHTKGMDSAHWIITEHDKYIWFSQTGEEQYFDLVHDPKELHNALHEEKGRVDELRAYLIDCLRHREEGFVADEFLIAGREVKSILSSAYSSL